MLRQVTVAEIQPVVRIANYHDVLPLQSWPQRIIPDLQLILIVQGHYEYVENHLVIPVQPGEILWIEPGIRHTFRHVDAAAAGLISSIHLELLPTGSWAAGDYRLAQAPERLTRVTDMAYLQERFWRMAQIFGSYLPHRELLTGVIAREIMLLLLGHWQQPVTSKLSPRMEAMLTFIRAHLQQPLSRQTLAAAFGVSPEHINLLFRRELGMPPSAVINRERVMLAYRLIHEQGKSAKEAAYAVGYSDPFYFSRVFKRTLGIPPSQVD
ncbi:MAG: AraC family transcriptional regulator [Caldilinea sp. CFX5]|nr:AraC family transcriptional regulator [Caldilinea sp. CFX5]